MTAVNKSLYRKEASVDMLDEALRLIQGGTISCVIIKDSAIVHTADGRGVSPLLNILDQEPDKLKDAFVVDKIIGKAAAMVLVLGGASRVYGLVMSVSGQEYLESRGVITEYGQCVDAISNRDNTGVCPIEKSVIDIDDPQEGKRVIGETMDRLKNIYKPYAYTNNSYGKQSEDNIVNRVHTVTPNNNRPA